MGLPWVRMDTNIASHDKILALISDPSAKKWQALSSYLLSIPWSAGQGTDGRIAVYALQAVHGTPATARLLVKYRLWSEGTACWQIVNFDQRQPTSATSEKVLADKRFAGMKGNCRRHHGDTCWRDGACSRAVG
jgi:hypothetical protein